MSELAARTPPRLPEGQVDGPRKPDRRVSRAPARNLRLPIILVSVLAGGTILYLAQAVLMPMALAVLLTVLLAPIVDFLERRRLGRVAPVLVVVVLMFIVLGGITWAIALQFVSLSSEIPRYRDNLTQKIADVRGAGHGGVLEQVQSAAKDVTEEIQKEAPAATPSDKPLPVPVPVVVRSEPSGLWQLPSLLEGLGSAAVVLVLVIFMLLERQELRNRLIRLIGYGRLTTTTRALDEAGQRISRYLLMQAIINGSFGLGIGVGVSLIGVPYAMLWGFLAAVLRFIPYVGPWVAAALVSLFSLAVFPGWLQPILVAGLFVVLELLSNLVMEPILYRQSAGASQVALLVAAAFWTWLWGPVGLILATPLTVCLVVLGKHVPDMEFLSVLLADQPAMDPDVSYYQRLLAMDSEEAMEIVDEYLKTHPLEAAYDHLLLPALSHAKRDRQRGRLSDDDEQFILQATRDIVDELGTERAQSALASQESAPGTGDDASGALRKVRVLGCPARDEADALALLMLQQILDPARWEVEIVSPHLLVSETLFLVETRTPAVVCIGALPSGGQASHTRHLCKRLRARFPDLKILVGRWGVEQSTEVRDLIQASGADRVGTTLIETQEQIQQLSHLEPTALPDPVPQPALPETSAASDRRMSGDGRAA
jgi:predicted PurR-regulated permease PerM